MSWITLTRMADQANNGERVMENLFSSRVMWISEEINESTVGDITCRLLALAAESEEPVKLFIYSPGGQVHAMFALADLIGHSPVPVHAYAQGRVASAAVAVFVSAQKRYAFPRTEFMIHSAKTWGEQDGADSDVLKKQARKMDEWTAQYFGVMKAHAKIPAATYRKALKEDVEFGVKEALEWGVVDEIIGRE